MKSFINFLLEGQAEIDSAIKRMDDIDTRREGLWAAQRRLERIVNKRTKPKEPESPSEKDDREFKNSHDTTRAFYKKHDKRFKPEVKNLMRSLSPEDLRGFLMTPDTEMNELIAKSNARVAKHSVMSRNLQPLPTNKTLLDRFISNRWSTFGRMVPADALKDTSDLLSVVRPKDDTSSDVADILNKKRNLLFRTTFRERKSNRNRMRDKK
jgi:hypothetical protein